MMILTVILMLYLDGAAIDAMSSQNEWSLFWAWVWVLLLGSLLGVFGGLHALSWSAFRSPWAEPGEKGGLGRAVQLLAGWPSVEVAAASLLRLFSGAALLFGGLTWFLRMAIEQGWFDRWEPKLRIFLALQWFRLAPLGLLTLALAPFLVALARGARGSVVHFALALGGSLLGWWVLYDIFRGAGAEFWRMVIYLMAWFPTYGCALLFGGAFWWGPSLLSGRKRRA